MTKARPRAVLYMRVSTADRQHPANQLEPLREWCKGQGFQIVHEYTDRESGARSDRPEFQAMMKAAARRQFDCIVCWSLDRFTREGISKTFEYLKRLTAQRIEFYSLQEPFLQPTDDHGMREIITAFVAWVADFERRRRQERIRAGIARARAEGVHIGRKPVEFSPEALAGMRKEAEAGTSLRSIAKKYHTSKSSVIRRLQQ